MSIPDYQTIMLPLLAFAADGQEHSLREATDAVSDEFKLTTEERHELLPSGIQPIILNRVGWAKTYLAKAGLLKATRRGYFEITERGRKVLESRPKRIDVPFLTQFPEFVEFQNRKGEKTNASSTKSTEADIAESTPEEILESAFQRLRNELAENLLQRIKGCSPVFFERLVLEVLVAMGYGGNLRDASERVGKSGDGGIDGIIKEDKLGLDQIYIQAKRWEGTVGRPEIQKFVGALQGQRARKGVFITTSSYTKEAIEYAANLESRVILIDGDKLAQLMMDYDVGVTKVITYAVKKVDTDYFSEDE